MLLTLINHPTPAFTLESKRHPGDKIFLGNVYRQTMPISLARVATILEDNLPIAVDILDLKSSETAIETVYKQVDLGDRTATVTRIGAAFEDARDAILRSDWIGLSNHFTFESGIIRDLIRYARSVKPGIKILVGGADAKARPHYYISAGADIVFRGDVDPRALASHDWSDPRVVEDYRHPFPDLSRPAFHKLGDIGKYTDSHDGPVPNGVTTPVGFIYFTRGCPRECDFCESRRTKFEALPIDDAIRMLEHYRSYGIRTLNFSDDNLLLLKRDYIITLFSALRSMGFAWEFPNGLEVGRFMRGDELDTELVGQLFQNHRDPATGNHVGAYRVFVPVETFDHRDQYKKLKSVEVQNRIIAEILKSGIPEINFGVVLGPDADEKTFEDIALGYETIKAVVKGFPKVKARYSVFHLIPIALFRSMNTNFSADEFPEGWNFYFPVYDGKHFSAMELFDRRIEVVQSIDPSIQITMKTGAYAYS